MPHTEFQCRRHKTSHEWWFSANKTQVLRPENRRPQPRLALGGLCKRCCVRNRQPSSTLHTSSCVHTSGCLWSVSQRFPLSLLFFSPAFTKLVATCHNPVLSVQLLLLTRLPERIPELSSRLPGHVVLVRGIRLLWSKRVGERKEGKRRKYSEGSIQNGPCHEGSAADEQRLKRWLNMESSKNSPHLELWTTLFFFFLQPIHSHRTHNPSQPAYSENVQ